MPGSYVFFSLVICHPKFRFDKVYSCYHLSRRRVVSSVQPGAEICGIPGWIATVQVEIFKKGHDDAQAKFRLFNELICKYRDIMLSV